MREGGMNNNEDDNECSENNSASENNQNNIGVSNINLINAQILQQMYLMDNP